MSYIGLFPNGSQAEHHITLCHVDSTFLPRLKAAVDERAVEIAKMLPLNVEVVSHMKFGQRWVAIVERTPELITLREMFEHLDRRSWTPHVTEQNGILWGVGVAMTFCKLEAR